MVVIGPPNVTPPPPTLSALAVRMTLSLSPVDAMLPAAVMTMSLCACIVRLVVPMIGPPGTVKARLTMGALSVMLPDPLPPLAPRLVVLMMTLLPNRAAR